MGILLIKFLLAAIPPSFANLQSCETSYEHGNALATVASGPSTNSSRYTHDQVQAILGYTSARGHIGPDGKKLPTYSEINAALRSGVPLEEIPNPAVANSIRALDRAQQVSPAATGQFTRVKFYSKDEVPQLLRPENLASSVGKEILNNDFLSTTPGKDIDPQFALNKATTLAAERSHAAHTRLETELDKMAKEDFTVVNYHIVSHGKVNGIVMTGELSPLVANGTREATLAAAQSGDLRELAMAGSEREVLFQRKTKYRILGNPPPETHTSGLMDENYYLSRVHVVDVYVEILPQ